MVKKRILFLALWVGVTMAIAIVAYLQGRKAVWISEFKTYQGNMVTFDRRRYSEDLAEFMKARYYYLANRIPSSWVAYRDYGQVSTNISLLVIGKGPTTAEEEYRAYKARGSGARR
jgi:hypothetical protein